MGPSSSDYEREREHAFVTTSALHREHVANKRPQGAHCVSLKSLGDCGAGSTTGPQQRPRAVEAVGHRVFFTKWLVAGAAVDALANVACILRNREMHRMIPKPLYPLSFIKKALDVSVSGKVTQVQMPTISDDSWYVRIRDADRNHRFRSGRMMACSEAVPATGQVNLLGRSILHPRVARPAPYSKLEWDGALPFLDRGVAVDLRARGAALDSAFARGAGGDARGGQNRILGGAH